MFPNIFCLGIFCLRTLSVFVVLAILSSLFILFKKTREEHFSEYEAFDAIFLAGLGGLLAGRVVYVLLNLPIFNWNFWQMLDIISYPGVNGLATVVTMGLLVYKFSASFTSDKFQFLDMWSTVVAVGLGIIWLGLFLDGTGYGLPTPAPLGFIFPGLVEAHLPLQLYNAIFFFLLAWYLHWVEYRYRTFSWYRNAKTSAQSGFLIAVSLIATSFWYLVLSWLRSPQIVIAGINFDAFIAMLGIIFGIILLMNRSGRVLSLKKS